ncbi:uncharacterized protein [Macaca nemestrina]|uniref:uncharacterized protein n=1 Tax=Macaca nemestrina TaxID=9545 RepID=UPI0039B93121
MSSDILCCFRSVFNTDKAEGCFPKSGEKCECLQQVCSGTAVESQTWHQVLALPPGWRAAGLGHSLSRAAVAAAAAAGPVDCEETAVPPGPRARPFLGSRLAPREARSSGSGGDPAGSARLRQGKQPRALLPPALCRRQLAEPTAGASRAQQLLSPGSKGGRREEPVARTQTWTTPSAEPAELLGNGQGEPTGQLHTGAGKTNLLGDYNIAGLIAASSARLKIQDPKSTNIINLKRTWEKLLLAAHAVVAIENPADVSYPAGILASGLC